MCVGADARGGRGHRRRRCELDFDELPAVVDMLAGAHRAAGAGARGMGRQRLPRDAGRRRSRRSDAGRPPWRCSRSIRTARQPMSPLEGRGVLCEWNRAPRAARHAHRGADAAHQPRGALRMPRPRPGRDPRHRARRRRRLRLQRASCCPRKSASPGSAAGSGGRCAGSRTAASSSRRTRTAASTTTTSRSTPTRRGKLARHRLRGDRRFGRVFVLPVLRLPGGGAGRLDPARPLQDGALPLPHLVGGDQQAADPALSRRRAHRRVLRARAHARRRRARARHGALRGAAARTSCSRTRCRTTTSPRSTSTAATIPRRCAARSQRSTCRSGARARKQASPTAAASASASPSTASRRRTAPRCTTAGASRWCRATSSASRASRPTACSSCASARTRTARAWRRRSRRWRTRCSASIRSNVRLIHGDTALTPYSTGTWGSRCMVMSGGAVADRVRDDRARA